MTHPATYTFPTEVTSQATVTASVKSLTIRTCELYPAHRSPVLEAHHIAPQSWWKHAGKPVNTPMAQICGLCHNNTHAALDALIRGISLSTLAHRPIALARRGLLIAEQNGLTPTPTL
jgi:hypothetical protein